MKIIPILLFSLLIFYSCAKKGNNIPKPAPVNFIVAGDSTSSYVHHASIGLYSLYDLNLDVNRDQINDLSFKYYSTTYSPSVSSEYFYVSAINDSQQVYICVDSRNYPAMLHKGDTINNALHWTSARNLILYNDSGSFRSGNWIIASDDYLGVKIVKNSRTCFAWLFIGGVEHERYFLRDFGYTDF